MPNGGTQEIEYNTANKYTIVTDAAGVVTKYEIDGLGRNKAKYISTVLRIKKLKTIHMIPLEDYHRKNI